MSDPSPIGHPVSEIRSYWDAHPLGLQYVSDPTITTGSPEFYAHIRPWMGPFKFPWIMPRIEDAARRLHGGHLLELGCGLGYDSLEFLKRGVRVTATDLTPTAVELTRRHFELEGVTAEEVRVENARSLSFPDGSFDAVWSRGVIHATGDPQAAVHEIHRVLRPGGLAIISHFYRRPSWMYVLHRWGRENIEYKEEDPPVNEFMTEDQVRALFSRFTIERADRDHYRALPVARRGLKALLYTWGFKPAYNLLPRAIAARYAYKLSITAVRR